MNCHDRFATARVGSPVRRGRLARQHKSTPRRMPRSCATKRRSPPQGNIGQRATPAASSNYARQPICAWSLLAGVAFASGRLAAGRFRLALIQCPVELVERGQAGRSARLLDAVDSFRDAPPPGGPTRLATSPAPAASGSACGPSGPAAAPARAARPPIAGNRPRAGSRTARPPALPFEWWRSRPIISRGG